MIKVKKILQLMYFDVKHGMIAQESLQIITYRAFTYAFWSSGENYITNIK